METPEVIRFGDEEFARFVQYINSIYGIDLSKKKILVECRLNRYIQKNGLHSLSDFMNKMKADKTGRTEAQVLNRLTTNYTYFLREDKHFEYLRKQILPGLQEEQCSSFRVLCAGCSSGEECYTMSMLLCDYRKKGGFLPEFRITGTDISETVLRKAEEARYPLSELSAIPAAWQREYLSIDTQKECFQILPEARNCVNFYKMNLLKPFGGQLQYDLILCRNVMIYFDEDSRRKLLEKLYGCLKPGGYLFVGHTELLYRKHDLFEYVCPAIYRKQGNK